MVTSPKETIETFLRDIMEEKFDVIIREPLKARINSRLDPIINEVGKNIDDNWLEDYKKNSISELLKNLDGYEYENIDFLKIYKDQLEEKLPSVGILLDEACHKTCDSVITEFRDILIGETAKNIIEDDEYKQVLENAGIDVSMEEIKITIQSHSEIIFDDLFSKIMKGIIKENKIIDGLVINIFEELPNIISDLAQEKNKEVIADALSIYFNTQIGLMVNQLDEFVRDEFPLNDEIKLEKKQENITHKILSEDLKEKHFCIRDGEVGYSYEKIFGPYLVNAKHIRVEDPYIRAPFQIYNFIMFCELALKIGDVKHIELLTSFYSEPEKHKVEDNLSLLKASLEKHGIQLSLQFNPKMHDRKVILDNGWVIKVGRGLDIYKPPPFTIGEFNYENRPCKETDVDIYRND